jgi:two-component system chemotaxis response regulator CheB
MATPPLRVLVVDDSAYNRKNIADILAGSEEIEVVGKAADGEEALRLATQLKPQAITLDLEMPRMDGFTFLRILMSRQPTPVIVVSSYAQKDNVFKALELGAIDFVAKPDRQFSPDALRAEILEKVLLVRSLRAVTAPGARAPLRSEPLVPTGAAAPAAGARSSSVELPGARHVQAAPRHLVAIASSTGGPTALLELFAKLPDRFPGAMLVAQHMPDKFTRTFAERLDRKGPVRTSEAQDGDPVSLRRGYVCPGKMCMELVQGPGVPAGSLADLRVKVVQPQPSDRYVPSADRLLKSVAQVGASRALGIILTGMGDDGVNGARAIRAAGGTVIAESEASAVVYGMPGAAVRAGVVNESLSLPEIVEFLSLLG